MKKSLMWFEGFDIHLGLATLKFKRPEVSEATIAGEPCKGNDFFIG